MRLRLFANLRYATPTPVRQCQFEARLKPISDDDQSCLDYHLQVKPFTSVTSVEAPEGQVDHFTFTEQIHEFTLNSEALVETYAEDPFEGLVLDEDDEEFYKSISHEDIWQPYLTLPPEAALPDIDRIISSAQLSSGLGAASFAISLTRLLNRAYLKFTGSPNNPKPPTDTADHLNQLMLQIFRREQIPARYVNGCIFNSDNAGEDLMQGWVECLMQDGKWHGFDLISSRIVNERYIKLHSGHSASDTAALSGRYCGTSEHQLRTLIRISSED